MNEKVEITVFRRNLTIEMEGFAPMEIAALAQRVDEKMQDIANQNPKIADSSKLAILTALDFAAQLYQMSQKLDTEQRAAEHKLEELTLALQSSLAAAGKK
jgi:cell division protein ZapA (FtsZ GTPase activity inhibitor)